MPIGANLSIILVLLVTGNLEPVYEWLIGLTTAGEPWTHIMRRNPWTFWVTVIVVVAIVWQGAPHKAVERLLGYTSMLSVGFLSGHVFW